MREEEVGMRYLSPLVKQDLAKLDADGESRRIALKSLKQFVEQLDASSMPRFLSQIAESRESGGSRSYAISLYEDVARVHGKLIVPHIPRVMTSLIRALAASGSSPPLQQACARVTAALARYTIDPAPPLVEAEDIVRDICDPLAEALAGKLEPVAAGAAACLHALAETEKWKYACDDVVHEVCQRTTVALSEKSTRTVLHMQLARALASLNPDTLSIYGASLLRAGEEVLRVTANSWQQRKEAAKLLQAVLTILDKETLDTELGSALHALDSCRLDRMPHVRAAVSEALHTAKMLASGGYSTGTPGASPICNKPSEQQRGGRSLWHNGDVPISPVSKRAASPTSQESHHLSFSPASTSTSESMNLRQVGSPTRSIGRRSKRVPLYPTRGMGFTRSPRCSTPGTSPSSSTTEECCESPSHKLASKENVPSRSAGVNSVVLSHEDAQGHAKYARPRAPVTPGAYTPLLPSQLDKFGTEPQKVEREAPQDLNDNTTAADHLSPQATRDASSRHMSPLVSAILDELTETATSIIAEDDAGIAQLDSVIEEEARHRRRGFGQRAEVVLPRLKLGTLNSSDSIPQSEATVSDGASNKSYSSSVSQKVTDDQNAKSCGDGDVEVEKREVVAKVAMSNAAEAWATMFEGSDEKHIGEGGSPNCEANVPTHHYNALAHLDASPEEKSKSSLLTAKDFLPFATPKQLMRALQSNLSSPGSRASFLEQDMKLAQDDAVPSGLTPHNHPDVVDMDVETSSEAGWSVRDNPIASDESFQADSSDEELEERRRGLYEAFAHPPCKVASAGWVSPREVHMVSPSCCRKTLSAGDTRRRPAAPAWFSDHPPPDQSGARAPVRAGLDMELDSGNPTSSGLSSVLQTSKGHCCACTAAASEGSVTGESAADEDEVDSLMRRRSAVGLEKKQRSWWDHRGLGQYLAVRLAARNWRKVCMYAELVLGGSLCVVLALPLAMVVAKALSAPRDYRLLVPT